MQLQPDVHREDEQDDRYPERHSPAPLGEGLGVHVGAAQVDDDERQEEAERRGRLDEARVVTAPVVRRMLRDVGRGAAVLAAEREALHQAQRHHQDRRQPADGCVGRQQADQERRCAHEDDGDEEGVLAADEVADAAEDQRAEGAHEKAGGISGECREQRRRLVARRKEQGGEERRQHRVQVKVVPLEDRAER